METVDNLFENAMKGRWKEVVQMYKDSPEARKAKITKSEDTGLHIAISEGQTKFALELVEIIGTEELSILNKTNDTPLHIAAALGDVKVCQSISSKNENLFPLRNCEGETPLFLAALHGEEKAFLCLHKLCKSKYPSFRNNDGDTILHAAISGEHFSLAFKIINYYPELVNSVNVDGLSPLHILANKPNAFKSSSRLRLFDRIIYHCIIVEELIVEETFAKPKTVDENKYPENYETCMNFLQLLRNTFGVLVKTQEGKMWTASDKGRKKKSNTSDEENPDNKCSLQGVKHQERTKGRKYYSFPPNYQYFILLSKLIMKTLMIILGMGIWRIRKIQEKKERHVWANQIMSKLVEHTPSYSYKYDSNTGRKPQRSTQSEKGEESELTDTTLLEKAPSDDHDTSITQDTSGQVNHSQKEHEKTEMKKIETPILIAAKMGVTEMLAKILDKFPVAIQDLNSENKNVVLLAIENRQPHVYKLLQNRKNILKKSVFRQLDNQGNSALHLAATFGKYQPWLIPGSALQIKWEIKWYKFVKNSMPRRFFDRYNKQLQTPKDVFLDTHKDLVKDGSEWLTKTAESCSVVAALIAAVAFATSTAVPGGVKEENGEPTLRNTPEFKIFAIASLVALCFSVTALVFFLSILTSRFQPQDFEIDLPRKLLMGLTSLFASIASMLISFCAGHVFLLNEQLRPVAYPLYAASCFPITFFAFAQLSLYIDLMWAIFKKVPQRSYNVSPH